MLREFARLAMAEQEAEGLDASLRYLADADRVCAETRAEEADFVRS
jgi:hypothetical protein